VAALGELDVSTDVDGSTTVVAIAGEVDLVTAPAVRTALGQVIDGNGLRLLVVDLSGVSFLDSTGIAAVAFAIRQSGDAGVLVRLCCVQPQVLGVLEITGLAAHWPLFDSRAEAAVAV